MSRQSVLAVLALVLCGAQAVFAGDSSYKFQVSLKNHINDNPNFPPSFVQTGTSPVGDVISGRLSATMNVDPLAIAALVNVNRPTRNDDLAGFTVGISFNESQGAGISLNPNPVGNVDSLGGVANKKGEITANFQGKLLQNGKKFRIYASNLNLQQLLSIPAPVGAGVVSSTSQIRIKIEAKGIHPETGNEIKVTLVDEIVDFNYTVTTRQDEADADGDGDTVEISYSIAKGKGTGKPSPK